MKRTSSAHRAGAAAPPPPRTRKEFRFEGGDVPEGMACGFVREMHAVIAAADGKGRGPDRLSICLPNMVMQRYIDDWADEEKPASRRFQITRPFDGRSIEVRVSLLTYGWGVDPVLGVLEIEGHRRRASSAGAAPKRESSRGR